MEPPVPTLARVATLVPVCLDTRGPVVRSRSTNVLEAPVATEAAAP